MSSNAATNTINDSSFTFINGNVYHNQIVPVHRCLDDLLISHVSQESMRDSQKHATAPRCQRDTRLTIRREIMEWIMTRPDLRKAVLWLSGPAGSGKTAILDSISDDLKRDEHLIASFYFGQAEAGCDISSKFVATLVYQLYQSIPDIKPYIMTAIEKDRMIFSSSLVKQMNILIIEPLKTVQHSITNRPLVVVVDAIDKCGPNSTSQAAVLKALKMLVTEFQHIPLLLLITGRPEYRICQEFSSPGFTSITTKLVLDSKYKPDRDIKCYLSSMLKEIDKQDREIGTNRQWYTENDINELVARASGQFIFAVEAAKFIARPRRNPFESLNMILGRQPYREDEVPFRTLDSLYLSILSKIPDHDLPKLQMILSILILSKPDSKVPMDIDSLEDILDIKDIRRTLIDMHSLVYVPPPDVPSAVYLHHKAFGDFLMDKARSGRYYIDKKERHTTIVEGLVKLLQDINTSRFHHRHCVPFFIDHLQFHAQRRTLRSSVISSTVSTTVVQVIRINNEGNGGLKRRRVEDGCSEEYRIYKRRC